MLGTLTASYVEAIREGVVPCVETALKSLALIENQRALTESVQLYKLSMDALDLPTKDAQVNWSLSMFQSYLIIITQ